MAQDAVDDPGADPPQVLPFDWAWEEGEPITPCRSCRGWWAELVVRRPGDAIWVREWHDVDCPLWDEVRGAEAGVHPVR